MDTNWSERALKLAPSVAAAVSVAEASWLFDTTLYRERYPEVAEPVLNATGFQGLYEHYLWIGDREGRSGSLFFDPLYYQAQLPPDDAWQAAAEGTCAHFLRKAAGRSSAYFDPKTYLGRYPAVVDMIAAGEWICPLHHYLVNDTPTLFDPLPHFSERFYLARYPDIARTIDAGAYRNGYDHFLQHGVFELRQPCEQIDLAWYVETHKSVAEDIACGRVRDAFAHYIVLGEPAGLAARSPTESSFVEPQAFRLREQAMLPVFARRKLDFTCTGPVLLSVAMETRDNFVGSPWKRATISSG